MKLDANGIPVESFGPRGLRLFPIPGAVRPFARTAAFDRAGNIVVLGHAQLSTGVLSFVFKVDPRGELLVSFAESGFWRASSCEPGVDALAVDPLGDIYVGAMCRSGNGTETLATLFRLDSIGHAVTSFGAEGVKTNIFEDSALQRGVVASVAMDAAGNLYVAGSNTTTCPSDFMIVRLAPDGSLVPFGSGGRVSIDMGTVNDRATVVRFDASGRIYLGGFATNVCPITRPVQLPAAVARLLP